MVTDAKIKLRVEYLIEFLVCGTSTSLGPRERKKVENEVSACSGLFLTNNSDNSSICFLEAGAQPCAPTLLTLRMMENGEHVRSSYASRSIVVERDIDSHIRHFSPSINKGKEAELRPFTPVPMDGVTLILGTEDPLGSRHGNAPCFGFGLLKVMVVCKNLTLRGSVSAFLFAC